MATALLSMACRVGFHEKRTRDGNPKTLSTLRTIQLPVAGSTWVMTHGTSKWGRTSQVATAVVEIVEILLHVAIM